jgi:hypothetical protein
MLQLLQKRGVTKDERLVDSLLELAEIRTIARALRFSSVDTKYTSLQEIPDDSYKTSVSIVDNTMQFNNNHRPITDYKQDKNSFPATRPQIHAIKRICNFKKTVTEKPRVKGEYDR